MGKKGINGIKLLVTDFDGTLTRSSHIHAVSWRKAMLSAGYKAPTKLDVLKEMGRGYVEIVDELCGADGRKKEVLENFYKIILDKNYPKNFRKIKGLDKFLAKLKLNGIKLAVASGNDTKVVNNWLKFMGIYKYFDYVIGDDKVRRGKPAPEMLKKVLKRFGFRKREVLYAGDAMNDYIMGKRTGIKTVIVLTGALHKKQGKKLKPFMLLNNITRLRLV
ncbi:MAG: HAD family hydrolase [Candidatus Aenigmarchaeota archaeon]|nr:HAD family hydrolase [Candidatus Aenigmarchaeota archaeon]